MIKFFFKEKFTILLGLLLIYMIAGPFLGIFMDEAIFLEIIFSFVMVSAVLTLSREQKKRIVVILLAVPCLVIVWFQLTMNNSEIISCTIIIKFFS